METIAIQIMLGGIAFRFYVTGRDDGCDGVDTGVDDESDGDVDHADGSAGDFPTHLHPNSSQS